MKTYKILQKTVSRSEFNKLYKRNLEQSGKIHCSRCKYNRGENDTRKYYGTTIWYINTNGDKRIRYPNWKLVSKNRKQWMNKNLKINIKTDINFNDYVNMKW